MGTDRSDKLLPQRLLGMIVSITHTQAKPLEQMRRGAPMPNETTIDPSEPQATNGSAIGPDGPLGRKWWHDKVNQGLVAIATLSATGIAVAVLGAFAFDSVTTALIGSTMVSVAAMLWIIWAGSLAVILAWKKLTSGTRESTG